MPKEGAAVTHVRPDRLREEPASARVGLGEAPPHGVQDRFREPRDIALEVVGLQRRRRDVGVAKRLLRSGETRQTAACFRPWIDPYHGFRRWLGMIHRPEPSRLEDGGDRETAGGMTVRAMRSLGARSLAAAKGFELRRGSAARPHELDFVEDPLYVVMKQCELHRPVDPRGCVVAHQGAAEEHVLGADEHRRALRLGKSVARLDAAHEDVDILRTGQHACAVP